MRLIRTGERLPFEDDLLFLLLLNILVAGLIYHRVAYKKPTNEVKISQRDLERLGLMIVEDENVKKPLDLDQYLAKLDLPREFSGTYLVVTVLLNFAMCSQIIYPKAPLHGLMLIAIVWDFSFLVLMIINCLELIRGVYILEGPLNTLRYNFIFLVILFYIYGFLLVKAMRAYDYLSTVVAIRQNEWTEEDKLANFLRKSKSKKPQKPSK